MAGACEGLRVLEVSRGMAGSLAGMLFADHGAEVIRIEKPGSDAIGTAWGRRMRDRGKKSINLNLEQPKERGHFVDLVKTADIAIVAMRRYSIERLGIDYQALTAVNPRLVYASITPFGWSWPDPKEYGYDAIVEARSGLTAEQSGFRKGPIYIAPQIGSYAAAIFCVQGTVAALHTLKSTQLGQHVDINLLSAALLYKGSNLIQAGQFQDDVASSAFATSDPLGALPMCNMNQCADGRWVALACQNRMFTERALAALESTDLMADPRFRGIPREFACEEDRRAFVQAVRERVARYPVDEVMRRLLKHDVPGEAVLTAAEYARHPQVEANGYVAIVDDPVLGRTVQPGAVIKLSETPPVIGRPAPLPGQDTREVLADLAARTRPEPPPGRTAQVGAVPQPGGPLRGVRVLDLTQYYAGPTGGRVLADYGAEVIKVELTRGDEFRSMKDTFSYANRGKKSIGLDLKSPEGREVLLRLVETADILFHSFRVGVPERLGLTYGEVSKRNPRIVYGWFTGFGRDGPMRARPGYESALAGMSGLGLFQSGQGNPPSYFAMVDATGGMSLVTGMLLALHARDRIGRGQLVEGSLMGGMVLFMGDRLMQYPGKPPSKEVDQGQHGMGPLFRLYETREGWFFLACAREKQWDSLRRVLADAPLGVPAFATRKGREKHERELESVLEPVFRSKSAREWEQLLSAADIPCATVTPSQREFLKADVNRDRAWTVTLDHPIYGTMRQAGPHLQFSRTPIILEKVEPFLGEDTEALLAQLGYSADKIDDMRLRNVVS